MPWLREFLRDYVAWTILDKVLDAFLAGIVLSALTAIVAYGRALGPAWKYGSVGALLAAALLSIVLGLHRLLSKRRALVQTEARHESVRKAAPATAAAATVTPDPKERVYLREQSTKEVLEHINSLKPLEKEVVSNQSYVGRWVRWSGRVMSIEPFALNLPSGSATVTVKDSQLITARLEFLPAAHHLVEGIEEGDAIDYEAMVTRIYEYAI